MFFSPMSLVRLFAITFFVHNEIIFQIVMSIQTIDFVNVYGQNPPKYRETLVSYAM